MKKILLVILAIVFAVVNILYAQQKIDSLTDIKNKVQNKTSIKTNKSDQSDKIKLDEKGTDNVINKNRVKTG